MLALDPATASPVLTSVPFDPIVGNQTAFLFMLVMMVIVLMTRVAGATGGMVRRMTSFLHGWMLAYVMINAILMSLTTILALVWLYDEKRQPKVPVTAVPIAAGILGVLGFEIIFRKFVIGFGEQKLDLDATLQGLLDQASSATYEREAP